MKTTVSEQLEMILYRTQNREMSAALQRIGSQCAFVRQNSTNKGLREFAEIIASIASEAQQ